MKSFTLKTNSMVGFLNIGESVVFENERFILNVAKTTALFDKEEGTVFVSNQWFGNIVEFPNAQICVDQWEATLTLRSCDLRIDLFEIKGNKAYGKICLERMANVREDGQWTDQFLEWNMTKFTVLFKERESHVEIKKIVYGSLFGEKSKLAIEQKIARYLWN